MGIFDDGIGGFFTDVLGAKNKTKGTAPPVDPNAYQYGGYAGGAADAAQNYANQAAKAQHQAAPQAANVGVDYSGANASAAQAAQARQGQASLAQIMAQRATGQAPSIAQQQADRQMQQAQASQASMAASARGAGALANAQRNAANNVANTQADISGQAQINGAQEQLNNTNAALSAYGALRGGDQASQAQNAQQAQFANQSAVNQNQFNATQQAGQNALNAQTGLAYNQLANQVNTTQLAAQQNEQAQKSANSLGAQNINASVAGQNAAMNQSNGMGFVSALGNVAGAIAGALAKGGPMKGRVPYLVGEKGPELVVPKKDGFVLTADQTRGLLQNSPASFLAQLGRTGDDGGAKGISLAQFLGMTGREDGGAISSGGAAPPPPADEAALLTNFQPAQSTWGGQPADVDAQKRDFVENMRGTLAPYDAASSAVGSQLAQSRANMAPINARADERNKADADTVWNADYKDRHGQSMTRGEEDAAIEARYRQEQNGKRDRAAKAKKPSLASFLTKGADRMHESSRAIDTSYHGGGGGYVPPQLIPLPARAGGGPVMGGGAIPGVGGGVDLGSGITHNELLAAGTGLGTRQAIPGMVGGGGITGGNVNLGKLGMIMGGGVVPAREDGGPITGGGAYDTKLTPAEEQAFQAWKKQYAPNDSGGDYDLRGAFKAGERPGANGHWTDRFKKPNHPTFSVESQYATGPNLAKAGHWGGDMFVPPQPAAPTTDTGGAAAKAAAVAEYSRSRGYGPSPLIGAKAQGESPVNVASKETKDMRETAQDVGRLAAASAALPIFGSLVPIGYGGFGLGLRTSAEQRAARDADEVERRRRDAAAPGRLALIMRGGQ